MNEYKARLIWSVEEVRKIYNDKKIWPSFIGLPLETAGGMKKKVIGGSSSTIEQQLAENLGTSLTPSSSGTIYMPLPVFLWKEQYMTILWDQQDKETSSGKKRKLECDGDLNQKRFPESMTQNHAENVLQLDVYNALYNLKNKQYFVGPADVYGGEYCLYKDSSPDQSHSVATVRVHSSSKMRIKELLAFTRVQNQVAKSAVIAYSSDDNENQEGIRYVIFNFRSVSTR